MIHKLYVERCKVLLANSCFNRKLCISTVKKIENELIICNQKYKTDHMSNITPKIISYLGSDVYLQKHPIGHLKKRMVQFIYQRYVSSRGNPLFSVYEHLSPVVSVEQNFDSLLVPADHVSRQRKDNYYINSKYLLRGHTTAHQSDLIKMGLNNFLMIGDVYRRDAIDSTHYPVFHQFDGVKLFEKHDVFSEKDLKNISLFETSLRTETSQGVHSKVALDHVMKNLQNFLVDLTLHLFGKEVEWKWVDAYFPFTNPSWELEIKIDDKWVEILGCGIIEQEILKNAGAGNKIGWAFGIGLERLAMKLYKIPDIRLFWSKHPKFISQFNFEDPTTPVTFKAFSNDPSCYNDISFWLPEGNFFSSQDFYELAREVGQDLIEQIELIDEFTHPKTGKMSHCYRVTYRAWDRVLTQKEVALIHDNLSNEAIHRLNVIIR